MRLYAVACLEAVEESVQRRALLVGAHRRGPAASATTAPYYDRQRSGEKRGAPSVPLFALSVPLFAFLVPYYDRKRSGEKRSAAREPRDYSEYSEYKGTKSTRIGTRSGSEGAQGSGGEGK